jgi:hypothetical protein
MDGCSFHRRLLFSARDHSLLANCNNDLGRANWRRNVELASLVIAV